MDNEEFSIKSIFVSIGPQSRNKINNNYRKHLDRNSLDSRHLHPYPIIPQQKAHLSPIYRNFLEKLHNSINQHMGYKFRERFKTPLSKVKRGN